MREYRRFKVIDESKLDAFEKMIDAKGITRADLILILQTIELNKEIYAQC